MEEKRNEIGRVLSSLLLSVKGRCTIRNLENVYKNEAGPCIPYEKFGNISAIDFLRSIPAHVRLVYDGDQYYVYPVVKKETEHIKNLVDRQKAPKMSSRKKSSRPSRYYPMTSTPRPFIPHRVQKSVAHMLMTNPSGVPRSQVAEQLQRSNAIAAKVDADNVDEFVSAMPHTAVSSGNKIYPSRSLGARPRPSQRRSDGYDGFDVVSPRDSQKQNISSGSPTQHHVSPISGESEIKDEGARYSRYDVRAKDQAKPSEDNRHKISSAEFISRAVGSQNTEAARELFQSSDKVMEFERHVEEAEDATYTSDEERSIDIIGLKMKERFQNLIKKHPDGIWCADLMEAYTDEYRLGFDYRDYGFSSVWHFASQLTDIFQLVRLNDRGDFKLYDANGPVPEPPSRPEPPQIFDQWQHDSGDEDINPHALRSSDMEELKLLPDGVMAPGESVGQVRIPEVSERPVYSFLEVYVAEVFTPSCFWVHLKTKREKLDNLMESLHYFYECEGDKYVIPTVVLEKGLNCVCKFEERWHRAIIKSVNPNGDVTLIFYDYGTVQTSPPNTVRFLARKFSNMPAQAIATSLINIKPKNSDLWTRAASTAFYSKVENIPLVAVVIKVDRENNSMLVSLVDTRGETDFHVNDWMVHAGFAEIGTLENSVQFEVRYLDDQAPPPVQNIVTSRAPNVPLITPQSTLPNSKTLRPPPGFAKPFDPINYAAIMDENLTQRNYNSTANANLFNYSNFNPIPPATTVYNSWSVSPELLERSMIQLLKMDPRLVAAVDQFMLDNRSTNTATNSTLNSTNVESRNPTVQPKASNPFQSYQDREISSTSSSKGSRHFLPNLSTSKFNTSHFLSSTILPQSSETKPNIFNEDSDLLDFDLKILREDADGDIDGLSLQLHHTNPFKQHIIGGDISDLVETNNNTLKAPPIPPRNPSSINKNVNLPAKQLLNGNPSTQIYYTAKPVRYNLNDIDKKREEEISKFGDSVRSSQEILDHSLSRKPSLEIRKRDSSVPVREGLSNDTQFLGPRISPSNYSPPPPRYTGNCTDMQYRNKTSVSPRYPSPLVLDPSRALIEDIQLPVNFFDKLESAMTENSDVESRDLKLHSGSFVKHSSSFFTTNITTSSTTSVTKNTAEPKKEYKIKLKIPKSLQGQESLDNQTKVLSDTLGIDLRFVEAQDFIERKENSSTLKQNDQISSWSLGKPDDGPKDSQKPRGHGNPFTPAIEKTETQNKETSWRRSSVDEQPLIKIEGENSRMSANGETTKDIDHLGFSTTTKPMHESPISSPHSYPSQLRYHQPMYPQHLPPHQMYPYPMPLRFPHQMPLHRPNMGFYPPLPPPWVRQQLYNAAYSHASTHHSQPPLNPNFWSHNPMFATPQAATGSNRAGAHHGEHGSKMKHSDLTRRLNESSSAKEKVTQNGVEKYEEEDTSFIVQGDTGKDVRVEESLSSSEESTNEMLNGLAQNGPIQPINLFKAIEVNKQTIYIFNIQHQGWVCTDELVQVFLPSETRNIVIRMLSMVNVKINFMEITRAQSPDLFAQLDDSTIRLPRMKNSTKIRGALHLTPIQLLCRMMIALRVISDKDVELSKKKKLLPGSNCAELVKLMVAYKSDDKYWTGKLDTHIS